MLFLSLTSENRYEVNDKGYHKQKEKHAHYEPYLEGHAFFWEALYKKLTQGKGLKSLVPICHYQIVIKW
jgi:hypothetical protein